MIMVRRWTVFGKAELNARQPQMGRPVNLGFGEMPRAKS